MVRLIDINILVFRSNWNVTLILFEHCLYVSFRLKFSWQNFSEVTNNILSIDGEYLRIYWVIMRYPYWDVGIDFFHFKYFQLLILRLKTYLLLHIWAWLAWLFILCFLLLMLFVNWLYLKRNIFIFFWVFRKLKTDIW